MAQLYFDPVIKTLQILGKEHGTQEAQPSCLVILSNASVSEASRITPGINSGVKEANANRSDVPRFWVYIKDGYTPNSDRHIGLRLRLSFSLLPKFD